MLDEPHDPASSTRGRGKEGKRKARIKIKGAESLKCNLLLKYTG